MANRKYDYIFWDFDGTVMDTYPGVTEAIQVGLEAYGIHEDRPEVLRSFLGPPFRVCLPETYGIDMELTEKIVAVYRSYYQEEAMYKGDMFPGVKEAAAAFRGAGFKQYITTSKPKVMCEGIISKKGWDGIFDGVFGASLDGRIDTKIQVLNEAFRVLNISGRSRVVLIGDTKYDADGAGEAGIDCIGITYGFGTREELKEHGATAIFDDLSEVVSCLIGE